MTTLVDAIEQKFEMLTDPCTDLQHVILCGSHSTLWKRQFRTASGSLRLPPVLVMDNSGVSTLGDLDQLGRMCGHVMELDLCNNRLEDWTSLLSLLGRLPRLRWLNLSINPMLMPPDTETLQMMQPPHLPELTTLVLNQVPITWPLLAALLSAAPNVSELYLCNNSQLGAPPAIANKPAEGFPKVRQLFFNGNLLRPDGDWACLAGWFPRLEKLNLIGSGIEALPDGQELLAGLSSLNLSENGLADWRQLEKLNAFPSLTDLRMLDIDLAKGRPKADFRSEAVARLPHVTLLNGTPVSDEERSTAERALIRRYMHTPDSDDQLPGQLSQLQAKHGHLDELANVDLSAIDSVNMVLRYGEQSRTCVVSTGQTVREVKRQACDQFGLQPASVHLHYVDQGMIGAYGPEQLCLPGRAFHSYRPEDGDELILSDRISSYPRTANSP